MGSRQKTICGRAHEGSMAYGLNRSYLGGLDPRLIHMPRCNYLYIEFFNHLLTEAESNVVKRFHISSIFGFDSERRRITMQKV